MAYEQVNSEWPKEIPAMTYAEGVTAAKRLYRKFMGRRCPWRFKETSGKRWGGHVHGGFAINPAGRDGYAGWWLLVHNISHHVARRLHPNAKPHSPQHAFIERSMIAHVVGSGWLAGKLARPAKARPPVDRRAAKRASLEARLKAWRTKAKRANTAMTKIGRALKRLDRAGAGTQ